MPLTLGVTARRLHQRNVNTDVGLTLSPAHSSTMDPALILMFDDAMRGRQARHDRLLAHTTGDPAQTAAALRSAHTNSDAGSTSSDASATNGTSSASDGTTSDDEGARNPDTHVHGPPCSRARRKVPFVSVKHRRAVARAIQRRVDGLKHLCTCGVCDEVFPGDQNHRTCDTRKAPPDALAEVTAATVDMDLPNVLQSQYSIVNTCAHEACTGVHEAWDGLLLSPRGHDSRSYTLSVCPRCATAIDAERMPKFAIANGL